jgi:thiol-disulfide isomerase/thioredoxin
MKRRQLLAGAGGLALTGGAAWVAFGGGSRALLSAADDDGPGAGASGTEEGPSADYGVTVDTLEAPGSTAGTQRLPVPGTVTLLDLFATWCLPCEAQMESLRAVHDDLGDEVAFVSVTNEAFSENSLTAEDVADWWREHDGDWTLGHDPATVVHGQVGASGLPYLVLTDATGRIVWTHAGVASEARLRREIEAALAGTA